MHFLVLTGSALTTGTALTKYMIADSRDVDPNSETFRTDWFSATRYKRLDAVEREKHGLIGLHVNTPDEEMHSVLLLTRCDLSLTKSGYLATASNNAIRANIVFIDGTALGDIVVLLESSELPADTDKLKKYFTIYQAFKQGDYPCLDTLLPSGARSSTKFHIVTGPAVMPVFAGDETHYGPYDEDAISTLTSVYPTEVVAFHAALVKGHNPTTQESILHADVASVVPDGIFKKYTSPHRGYAKSATFELQYLSTPERKKVKDDLEVLELKIENCIETSPYTSPSKTGPPSEIETASEAPATESESSAQVQSRTANVMGLYSKCKIHYCPTAHSHPH